MISSQLLPQRWVGNSKASVLGKSLVSWNNLSAVATDYSSLVTSSTSVFPFPVVRCASFRHSTKNIKTQGLYRLEFDSPMLSEFEQTRVIFNCWNALIFCKDFSLLITICHYDEIHSRPTVERIFSNAECLFWVKAFIFHYFID